MAKLSLETIDFKFFHGNDIIKVSWMNMGRGEVNGRMYARKYRVDIFENGIHIRNFATSMQANITNSEREAREALDQIITR